MGVYIWDRIVLQYIPRCGYTLTDFPISIRLTSLALWQSNDCPSASKATLMNMEKYFMWIHYERLHNHNKAKHNKTVCIFLGIYCMGQDSPSTIDTVGWLISTSQQKWSGSKCMGLKPLVDENALHNRFRHKFVRNMSYFHQCWASHISHTHQLWITCMIIDNVFIILLNTCFSSVNPPKCYFTFRGV